MRCKELLKSNGIMGSSWAKAFFSFPCLRKKRTMITMFASRTSGLEVSPKRVANKARRDTKQKDRVGQCRAKLQTWRHMHKPQTQTCNHIPQLRTTTAQRHRTTEERESFEQHPGKHLLKNKPTWATNGHVCRHPFPNLCWLRSSKKDCN